MVKFRDDNEGKGAVEYVSRLQWKCRVKARHVEGGRKMIETSFTHATFFYSMFSGRCDLIWPEIGTID